MFSPLLQWSLPLLPAGHRTGTITPEPCQAVCNSRGLSGRRLLTLSPPYLLPRIKTSRLSQPTATGAGRPPGKTEQVKRDRSNGTGQTGHAEEGAVSPLQGRSRGPAAVASSSGREGMSGTDDKTHETATQQAFGTNQTHETATRPAFGTDQTHETEATATATATKGPGPVGTQPQPAPPPPLELPLPARAVAEFPLLAAVLDPLNKGKKKRGRGRPKKQPKEAETKEPKDQSPRIRALASSSPQIPTNSSQGQQATSLDTLGEPSGPFGGLPLESRSGEEPYRQAGREVVAGKQVGAANGAANGADGAANGAADGTANGTAGSERAPGSDFYEPGVEGRYGGGVGGGARAVSPGADVGTSLRGEREIAETAELYREKFGYGGAGSGADGVREFDLMEEMGDSGLEGWGWDGEEGGGGEGEVGGRGRVQEGGVESVAGEGEGEGEVALVVEEEDPDWPAEGETGWGFPLSPFFQRGPDYEEEEAFWEREASMLYDVTLLEWEMEALIDSFPMAILVYTRHGGRQKENRALLPKIKEMATTIWLARKAPLKAAKLDASSDPELAALLGVGEGDTPAVVFTHYGKCTCRLYGENITVDQLVSAAGYALYKAPKPAWLRPDNQPSKGPAFTAAP